MTPLKQQILTDTIYNKKVILYLAEIAEMSSAAIV